MPDKFATRADVEQMKGIRGSLISMQDATLLIATLEETVRLLRQQRDIALRYKTTLSTNPTADSDYVDKFLQRYNGGRE